MVIDLNSVSFAIASTAFVAAALSAEVSRLYDLYSSWVPSIFLIIKDVKLS